MKRETEDLEQYEAHFKAKMQNFEIELQDLDALQVYLDGIRKHIDGAVTTKMQSLHNQNQMKQERFTLLTKLDNQQAHGKYQYEKLN